MLNEALGGLWLGLGAGALLYWGATGKREGLLCLAGAVGSSLLAHCGWGGGLQAGIFLLYSAVLFLLEALWRRGRRKKK